MCGIVGYIGGRDCAEVLLDGLQKLEYRGYDSAGIAVVEGGRVLVQKTKGRLQGLRERLEEVGMPRGHCGIGHTRWATHVAPSDCNAHPHSAGQVTLVHNGIIENDRALKAALIREGCTFLSDTDTEVVAQLLDRAYHGDPAAAIRSVTARLRGSYALAVLFADRPETLYAVRRDSPLIVGIGRGERFIASDIPAILRYTRDYCLLEEDELAVLHADGVDFFNAEGEPVEKPVLTAAWDLESAQMGGFPHFMLKEIHEQPAAFAETISPRIRGGLPDLELDGIPGAFLSGIRRLYIVACGTAMHAGLVGKCLLERLARVPAEVEVASEFRYRDPLFAEGDAVLVISQSGETADTLAAVELARKAGAFVFGICNVVGSSIARATDSGAYIHVGPEIGVASTKAFTGQVTVMAMLALAVGREKGTVTEEYYREVAKGLLELPAVLEDVLGLGDRIADLSKIFTYAHNFIYLGRGYNYPTALEGALKLKEISYIHAEGYPAAEMKHGAIALIDNEMPTVAIATPDNTYEKTASNIEEIRARGGKIIAVIARDDTHVRRSADYTIEVPVVTDCLMPIVVSVPLQLLAYYIAVNKGRNVDQPRNLAKSVTVE